MLFSKVAASICIPTNSTWGFFFFSTSLPIFVFSCVFDFSHSDRCEVIYPCAFDLHFSADKWYWASFHESVGHLGIFGEVAVHVFCPFLIGLYVFWVMIYINSLYILDSNPLSDMSFSNIFPHWAGCLFILLIVSFTVQKIFILT